jgi:hypothetical protein
VIEAKSRAGGNQLQENAPQTRHKPKQTNSDNGGFLRATEDWLDVARIASKGRYVSASVVD